MRTKRSYSKHGLSGTRFYNIWDIMKKRCRDKNRECYKYYGGKGIIVCEEWKTCMSSFKNDMYESYLEHVKEHGEMNTTIDRINNNGNYCKENCRWATRKEQNNNFGMNKFLTYKEETLNITQWADKLGFSRTTLYNRLQQGWSTKRTLETLTDKKSINNRYK